MKTLPVAVFPKKDRTFAVPTVKERRGRLKLSVNAGIHHAKATQRGLAKRVDDPFSKVTEDSSTVSFQP